MVEIRNTSTQKEIRQALGLGSLEAPTQATPVVNVNPKDYQEINVIKSAASGTIHTTPTDKDSFLYAVVLSQQKAVGDSLASSSVDVTPFGQTTSQSILAISGVTLTADAQTVPLVLRKPIRLARGSAIPLTKSAANGNCIGIVHICETEIFENNL